MSVVGLVGWGGFERSRESSRDAASTTRPLTASFSRFRSGHHVLVCRETPTFSHRILLPWFFSLSNFFFSFFFKVFDIHQRTDHSHHLRTSSYWVPKQCTPNPWLSRAQLGLENNLLASHHHHHHHRTATGPAPGVGRVPVQ